MIYFKNKEIVLPGELVLEGDYNVLGEYEKIGNKYYAKVISIFEVKENKYKITPLVGNRYIPKLNDFVIGIIDEVGFSGWIVDINSPYKANLPLREGVNEFVDVITQDLSKYYDYGDIIACKIINVPKSKYVQVTTKGENLGKLKGGRLIYISPHKVARVIGKNASMINLLKETTKSKIFVGQNGVIWIKNNDPFLEKLTAMAIFLIEQKSTMKNLTEYIKKFLEENIK